RECCWLTFWYSDAVNWVSQSSGYLNDLPAVHPACPRNLLSGECLRKCEGASHETSTNSYAIVHHTKNLRGQRMDEKRDDHDRYVDIKTIAINYCWTSANTVFSIIFLAAHPTQSPHCP